MRIGRARPSSARCGRPVGTDDFRFRMRSQVQVLAGPPTIIAGQSAAGTEPGALAVGLGRAGADQRDLGSVARVPASLTVVEPSTGRQPQGLHPFRWSGSPRPARPGSPPPPPEHGRRPTRPDRRGQTADGRTPHGWTPDGWTLEGWTADGRRRTLWTTTPGDRTPDGWTAGSRTPIPGWVDTACWTPATDAVAWLLAVSTTATTPDRSVPAGRSAGQTPSGRATTRTAQPHGRRGHPRC
jgi:hypothetical protein